MCIAGLGFCVQELRGLQYLCFALGCIHARGQKTFLHKLHRYIDTQAAGQANGMGRGVHGPDERPALRGKQLFTHNVKLYNCAAGKRGYQNLQYEAVNLQTSVCDGV